MKALKVLFVFSLLIGFASHGLIAQHEGRGEKRARMIKAKKAYIQEKMSFTADESDRFVAIFDAYHAGRHDRVAKKRKDAEGIKSMTDAEAEAKFERFIEGQRTDMERHIAYLSELKAVLGAKRVLQLHKVERSFNTDVLKTLKAKKKGSKGDSKG